MEGKSMVQLCVQLAARWVKTYLSAFYFLFTYSMNIKEFNVLFESFKHEFSIVQLEL